MMVEESYVDPGSQRSSHCALAAGETLQDWAAADSGIWQTLTDLH